MQSDNIKNEAEDITKDDYVFSKCVLDCDTCNFNKEALNGCVKAVKLKPQKWSIHCLRLSHGFWKPKPPVVSSTSHLKECWQLSSHQSRPLHKGARCCIVSFPFYVLVCNGDQLINKPPVFILGDIKHN